MKKLMGLLTQTKIASLFCKLAASMCTLLLQACARMHLEPFGKLVHACGMLAACLSMQACTSMHLEPFGKLVHACAFVLPGSVLRRACLHKLAHACCKLALVPLKHIYACDC